MMLLSKIFGVLASLVIMIVVAPSASALSTRVSSRRAAIGWMTGGMGWVVQQQIATASGAADVDIDDYLQKGFVLNPMGVSGQAGKSKPETGVLLRDGSEVSRDKNGNVLAEILVKSTSGDRVPVLASFVSPWPVASGTVFDVECRNPKTGDGSFLAVTSNTKGKSIGELKDSFFVDQLIAPTGRFSFYGTPTDVKVKSSSTSDDYRIIDISFSTLSQSTQTEIPRRARLVARIPEGTEQAVMLVGSASALRWNKGSKEAIAEVTDSFRAIPAPTSSLKMRAKERRSAGPGRLADQ